MKILLRDWAAARYAPIPPDHTLRRWARTGEIQPKPELAGKHYYVDERAERVGTAPPLRPSLVERMESQGA